MDGLHMFSFLQKLMVLMIESSEMIVILFLDPRLQVPSYPHLVAFQFRIRKRIHIIWLSSIF